VRSHSPPPTPSPRGSSPRFAAISVGGVTPETSGRAVATSGLGAASDAIRCGRSVSEADADNETLDGDGDGDESNNGCKNDWRTCDGQMSSPTGRGGAASGDADRGGRSTSSGGNNPPTVSSPPPPPIGLLR
jgi:hypothetical protein